MCLYVYAYIYIYTDMGICKVFQRPHWPPPSVFKYILYICTFQSCSAGFKDVVHVSEMLCTCQRCCAPFPAVAHVSQKLCMCSRSCARFTSPLITFVFNCMNTERILISKNIGATKPVLPIYIYIYAYIHYIYIYIYIRIHTYAHAHKYFVYCVCNKCKYTGLFKVMVPQNRPFAALSRTIRTFFAAQQNRDREVLSYCRVHISY